VSKRLVILGAGESGVGAAILGKQEQFDVFVSDRGRIATKYKDLLLEENIAFEEGCHSEEKILTADLVVKSPGIPDRTPLVEKLRNQDVSVISEIEFGSWFTQAKLIGITGSNGKTTTTSLVYHILKSAGYNVGIAGNIGDSFALQVAKSDYEYYVLELSSFQLDGIVDLKLDISILLNITTDHLDRYNNNLSEYIDAKFQLIKNVDQYSVFFYNSDDHNIVTKLHKTERPHLSYAFSINGALENGIGLESNEIIIDINKAMRISVDRIPLKGKHNAYNIMASVSVASVLGVDKHDIMVALASFQPIEHRMEQVVVLNGVEYINDSKATNVDSVFYALESITNKIIWIAGGVDKGNDYSQLLPLVKSKVHGMVCLGKDNSKLHEVFGDIVHQITDARSAYEAVQKSSAMAEEGFTVLLSPACASFDLFENYEDRGKKFKHEIYKLNAKFK
tara:strand:+ start:8874 stop:10223 length:1350 start_codon:yes stop_codon:yes gene_type:complete